MGIDERFVLKIVLLSFVVRILVSPIYVEYPHVPHDMWVYVGGGRCFLDALFAGSDCLRNIHLTSTFGNLYGILFQAIMSVPVALSGGDYAWMKIPSIIADSSSIYLVYLIARRVSSSQKAKYAAVLYAFSYIAFYSSSVLGGDDNIFIMFTLLSVLMVLEGRVAASAASLSIAFLLKLTPLTAMPAILYYVHRKHGIRKTLHFTAVFLIIFLLFFTPHYLIAGEAAIAPYTAVGQFTIFGIGFLNLVRMSYGLPYHVLHPELPRSFSETVPESPLNYYGTNAFSTFLRQFSTILLVVGVLLLLAYLMRSRMKNADFELIRNVFMITFFVLMFSKTVDSLYFQWILPYLIILFAATDTLKPFQNGMYGLRHEYSGYIIIVLAAVTFSLIFRWSESIPPEQKLLLVLGMILAVFATFVSTEKLSMRKKLELSGLTLTFAMDRILPANALTMLHPLFSGSAPYKTFSLVTRFGWNYVNGILCIIMAVVIFREVDRITKNL